ncbi:FAD:protein FMN transferase [Bifidobacterium sp. CP2]|uniref:FAD:protein FMN transferase n=1 Tax=Bifidobacterium sp. CP2 TaxID=2809025 RepID=UPI001F0A89A0|nr:FAD:protein FMN transferase [Bifidobacterium sp. CP2]
MLLGDPSPADVTVDPGPYGRLGVFIDEYERALSRFRPDSTVSAMRAAAHGGSFDFPDWTGPLFDLYDLLSDATEGAVDPCVGEDLIRLGYDARYSFRLSPDVLTSATSPTSGDDPSGWNLGAVHGRATWRDDVERHDTTLVTRRPVALDFGACGKGYLVDLLAERLTAYATSGYVIDAGGDLRIQSPDEPLTIALEDPADATNAVGTATVDAGAFCASAPSRRHWEAAGRRLHHLLNAVDGLPVDDVAATWVYVTAGAAGDAAVHTVDGGDDADTGRMHRIADRYPTAVADGLATALFTTPANTLHNRLERLGARLPFECAVLNADRTAVQSSGFPGGFFAA